MESFCAVVFLAGSTWVAYVYIGYPVLIWILARLLPHPVQRGDSYPRVTLLISAHNEEAVIGQKLDNALALDYPSEKFRVVVSSDGSTDRTNEIVAAKAALNSRVSLRAYPENRGKTAALMDTVHGLDDDSEVVVFSDANGMYESMAIRQLVRHFADDRVGCVAGELVYSGKSSEGLYRRYENWIKRQESSLWSCMMAEGSIFAARRDLIPRIDPTLIEDMLIPLTVTLGGHRVIYEPTAISVEPFDLNWKGQFNRRMRIVNRSFRSLGVVPGAWNPLRSGMLAVQFLSHRVMRWLSPAAFVAAFAASLGLLGADSWLKVAPMLTLGALALLMLAGLSVQLGVSAGPLRSLWYFFLGNAAMMAGVFSALIGKKIVTWRPERGAGTPSA